MVQNAERAVLSVESILDRLRMVLKCENDAQLGRALGIPQTTISSWKRKRIIPYEACVRASQISGAPLDVFIFGHARPNYSEFAPINERLFDLALRKAAVHIYKEERADLTRNRVIELGLSLYNRYIKLASSMSGSRTQQEIVDDWSVGIEGEITLFSEAEGASSANEGEGEPRK